MICQACGHDRMADVSAKADDMCTVKIGGKKHEGYVPGDIGIGGGDYIEMKYCLDCGKIAGTFPLPPTTIENPEDDDAFSAADDEESEDAE